MNKNEAQKRSEAEIDDLIAAQADDDTAWEESVKVHKTKSYLLKKPGPTGQASHQTVVHVRVY